MTGGVPFATPISFQDLGAFVLRDHALHLHQQLLFRIVTDGMIEKHHFHPRVTQFLPQQDLVGILAGQSVRRVDLEPLDQPQGRHVPQPLQGRPRQGRPTVAVVEKR